MRLRFEHPKIAGKIGYAGLDLHLPGIFFGEVEQDGQVRSCDGLTTGAQFDAHKAPLESVLFFLAHEGFFTVDQLHETLALLQDGRQIPKRLHLVEKIVTALKDAAMND